MNVYIQLMRLDKPIGIYLLLYPTLWALWIANQGLPNMKILVIFVLGVILMRSAGCVINDIADRKIDKHIKRTQGRPITSGKISLKSALWLFFMLILLAFFLVLLTNKLTILLSFLALGLASLYPFMKRWTYLPQLVLGLAFSMSIPMAFSASLGVVPAEVIWLVLANTIWTISYDTMYAMADKEEDLKVGVKSTAILFGQSDLLIIGLLQGILLVLLGVIGWVFALTSIYFISLLSVLALMIYYQFLIKKRQKDACFKAFLHNHYLGLMVWGGLVVSYI